MAEKNENMKGVCSGRKHIHMPLQVDSSVKVKKSKKPSMKTATDVIHRIIWDEAVPQDLITIGYTDRFVGIVEKPFGAFSWEPLDSLDYFTFGIPKHRIEYFKYREAIVWHKKRRLDNVFGSDGSGKTIDVIIKEYDVENYPADAATDCGTSQDRDDCASSVSDGTDGVNLMTDIDGEQDTLVDNHIVKGRTTTGHEKDESESLSEDEDTAQGKSSSKSHWMNKMRPNFFVCQRVQSSTFTAKAKEVQAHICSEEPLYETCCYAPQLFHMTLCTLRLTNAEQVSLCMQTLANARDELDALKPTQPLRLNGLSSFSNRVLYVSVQETPELLKFVDHLELVLQNAGFPVADTRDFVPHITLMKVSRPITRKLGPRSLKREFFEKFVNTDFGEQAIDSVYLCSMEKCRGADGFYIAPGCVGFIRPVLCNE